ncbi:MAG: substrate-binding domain-containing protein [Bacteroidota bacterium]|nr:substrate-binding domain-containing protein [Bacteroidota bacterium]
MKKCSAIVGGLLLLLFTACENQSKKDQRDSPTQGTIHISVDESFKPVIDAQLQVYHASYPNTNIIAEYKSEADCFKDLQNDSTRMIIVARGLDSNEIAYYTNKLSFKPQFDIVAYDAVAAIVNEQSKDSVFTLARLNAILSGKEKKPVVMDGHNATSTVRYLKDSVLKGGTFGPNVMAVKGSDSVVQVVSNSADAIGFVGISWVGNPYEPKQIENLKKIRLALLECKACDEKNEYAKPSQATLTFGQYPLARPLYYILKENANGLGTGFANFLSLERGQLVFRRAILAPAKMNLNERSVR